MSFSVTALDSTGALCTLAQVKARGLLDDNDTERDTNISTYLIPAVLPRFNTICHREFMPQVTEARTFPVYGRWVQLHNADLRSATAVVFDPDDAATTLTAGTDYELQVDKLTETAGRLLLSDALALATTQSSYFGHSSLQITGAWGLWDSVSEVDTIVKEAAIECVLSWLDKPIAQITGFEPQLPVNAEVPSGQPTWDVPRSAWLKLKPYIRELGMR